MQCHQFEQILEQQGGEVLPEPALAHVDVCEGCRNLFADMEAIHAAAAGMDSDGVAPPAHIWASLRNQLEAEGLVRTSKETKEPVIHVWWSLFQRPALAGAFLALVLSAGALLSYQQGGSTQIAARAREEIAQEDSPVPSADTIFREEVLTVGNNTIPGFKRQDTSVIDSIHRNLRIVDNFIALCEKSVREQPDNPVAREYLYGAYQQKAELLATAMDHGTMEGVQ